MINKTQVIPLLLAACPEFYSRWEKHLAYWGDDERGPYTDIAQFAHFLVEGVRNNQTDCFISAFQSLERLIVEGDEEVRGVLTIGLLEDVQNIASHSGGYDIFLPWLGPETRRAWVEIERMWEGKHSLMDVLRAERQQDK
ncbi:MAG: DUF7674 family protein [Thermomicrobiales bacterium]